MCICYHSKKPIITSKVCFEVSTNVLVISFIVIDRKFNVLFMSSLTSVYSCMKDTEFEGFTVPKGAQVV